MNLQKSLPSKAFDQSHHPWEIINQRQLDSTKIFLFTMATYAQVSSPEQKTGKAWLFLRGAVALPCKSFFAFKSLSISLNFLSPFSLSRLLLGYDFNSKRIPERTRAMVAIPGTTRTTMMVPRRRNLGSTWKRRAFWRRWPRSWWVCTRNQNVPAMPSSISNDTWEPQRTWMSRASRRKTNSSAGSLRPCRQNIPMAKTILRRNRLCGHCGLWFLKKKNCFQS